MRRIIQIKGNHGSGKTTLMNNLIKKGDFIKQNLRFKQINCCLLIDKNTVILAHQNSKGCNFDGLDAIIRDRNDLLSLVKIIITKFTPRDLIFEGAIYGATFKLSRDIEAVGATFQYDYINVWLRNDVEKSIQHILLRNGGKSFNFKTIKTRAKRFPKLFKDLEQAGQPVHVIDVDHLSPQQVLEKFLKVVS